MSNRYLLRGICAALGALAIVTCMQVPASASHTWSNFHWRRTSSALTTIPVRRYHSAVWVTRYNAAIARWRSAAMTKIRPATVLASGPRSNCASLLVAGAITSCDGAYGNTGWLGLATVWTVSGGHIYYARSLVNNTYYAQSYYNNIPWRQMVICQEIGHTFGVGHVNVTYNTPNTGSCMDYTNDPDGGAGGVSNSDPSNMNPNAHDYALINAKHTHIGALIPGFKPEMEILPAAMAAFKPTKLSQLGTLMAVGDGGRTERYEMDFGNGFKATSFAIRAR